MKPLRICVFARTFLPKIGGAEWITYNLARALQNRGHDITVLTRMRFRRGGPLPEGVRVVRHPRLLSKQWGTRMLLPFLHGVRFRYGIDIVHCHAAYPQAYIASAFKRQTGIPYLITVHGTEIVQGERERTIPRVERRVMDAARDAGAVVAISRYMAQQIASAGVPEDRIPRIGCGVDVQRFATATPFRRPRRYLFTLARMHKIKGIDILLKAWAQVMDAHPEWDLLVAGDGPEIQTYRGLSHSLGLDNRVEFLGSVSEDFKPSLYRGAGLFVCSSHLEHFGITNVEALSAGLPIVSTNAGGITDVLTDDKNAVLVAAGEVEPLAHALHRVLGDPDLRTRLGRSASESATAFDIERVAEAYEALYDRILRERGR